MLGAVSGATPAHPPAFGGAPRLRNRRSEGPEGLRGPRRSGGLRVSLRSLPGRPPGLWCSSRRALRRSRFRCPLGFPFSLSPLLYLHSINRHPPVSSPSGVSFATFLSTIRHGNLHTGNLLRRSSRLHLRSRNLPGGNLPASNLRQRNLPGGNLHLRSGNLRLRR